MKSAKGLQSLDPVVPKANNSTSAIPGYMSQENNQDIAYTNWGQDSVLQRESRMMHHTATLDPDTERHADKEMNKPLKGSLFC